MTFRHRSATWCAAAPADLIGASRRTAWTTSVPTGTSCPVGPCTSPGAGTSPGRPREPAATSRNPFRGSSTPASCRIPISAIPTCHGPGAARFAAWGSAAPCSGLWAYRPFWIPKRSPTMWSITSSTTSASISGRVTALTTAAMTPSSGHGSARIPIGLTRRGP